MLTVPALMGLAHNTVCEGPHRCFYCAAPCGPGHPASEYVKDSFTGRDTVPCPSSPWVCPGCVLCLREDCEVTYHDASTRRVTKAAMRMHSWVITRGEAVAATRAHLAWLRATCLNPPLPPFAVSLADSGQKQLLYRGVVSWSREAPAVTLEGERIRYTPSELAACLEVCGRLVAATGKPALEEPITPRFALAVMAHYADGEHLLLEWEAVRETPLSRLAAWLCPSRDECRRLHPAPAGAVV